MGDAEGLELVVEGRCFGIPVALRARCFGKS
jgi:hypothetical protein